MHTKQTLLYLAVKYLYALSKYSLPFRISLTPRLATKPITTANPILLDRGNISKSRQTRMDRFSGFTIMCRESRHARTATCWQSGIHAPGNVGGNWLWQQVVCAWVLSSGSLHLRFGTRPTATIMPLRFGSMTSKRSIFSPVYLPLRHGVLLQY